MATGKEQTLKINDFLGISRYYNSPNQPPNKLYTLQNLYSPTKGELALLGGVTNIGAGMPGVTAIKHVEFLKTAIGYERLLAFFDHAAIPTPSAPTAVAVTGTAFSAADWGIFISYVGMGGESEFSPVTGVTVSGTKNIQVTLPTLPDGVVAVNIFAYSGYDPMDPHTTSGRLCAVVSKRKNLSFPSTVTLDVIPKTTGASALDFRYTAASFNLTFGTTGTLEPGRVYYFGIQPAFGSPIGTIVQTKVGQATLPTVQNPTGRIFSFTVPEGYNSVQINFTSAVSRRIMEQRATSAPYEFTQNTTDSQIPAWVFIGTTPDDLMAVCGSIDGVIKPQAQSSNFALTVDIAELPYNSNFSTYKQMSYTGFVSTDYSDIYNFIQVRANDSTGGNGTFYENWVGSSFFPNVSGYGIYALEDTTYNANTSYQIMPSRGGGQYTKGNVVLGGIASFSSVFVPSSAGQMRILDSEIQSASYINRMYFANNEQCPFYTNGYVLVQAPRKAQTPYIPITKEIALFNERIILGGGENSLFNTQNVVYYAVGADPETWTATPANTAALQFISALEADSDSIVGFGIFSESLAQAGFSQFLLIGKSRSVYTWSGSPSAGAVQVTAETGFASNRSFALSARGPIVVGRENVYLVSSGGVFRKIGNDVEAILRGISDANITSINAHYHETQIKIGYKETADLDREIWLDLREDGGQLFPIFTGPHVMKSYSGVAVTNSFAGVRDFRVSYLGDDLFKRDNKASYLNDGADIAIFIESNDVGFGAEEFAKIITQFFMRAKIKKSETITMGITVYDSSSQGKGLDYSTDNAQQTYTPTMVLPYGGSGTIYRNFMKQFPERYRGDMLRYTLALSTNVDFRIQALNWLFNIDRRRLL